MVVTLVSVEDAKLAVPASVTDAAAADEPKKETKKEAKTDEPKKKKTAKGKGKKGKGKGSGGWSNHQSDYRRSAPARRRPGVGLALPIGTAIAIATAGRRSAVAERAPLHGGGENPRRMAMSRRDELRSGKVAGKT